MWGLDEKDLKHKVVFLKNKDLAFSKMLPDESKNCLEIKYIYGAYLNSIIEEYERIRLLNGKRHKENISQFIKSLSQSLTELHISVSVVGQAAYFDEVKDEEELIDNDNEIIMMVIISIINIITVYMIIIISIIIGNLTTINLIIEIIIIGIMNNIEIIIIIEIIIFMVIIIEIEITSKWLIKGIDMDFKIKKINSIKYNTNIL